MAEMVNDTKMQNEQSSEFARFKAALKVILTVPKDEVLKREEQAKAEKGTRANNVK